MSQENEKTKAMNKDEELKNNVQVDGNKEINDEDLGNVSGGSNNKPNGKTPYWTNTPY